MTSTQTSVPRKTRTSATSPERADRVAKIRELAAAHWSDAQIGAELGVCAATVQRTRKANDIPPGYSPGLTRTTVHGTPGMWRRCNCTTCNEARNAAHRRYVAQMQNHTPGRQSRLRWTPEEDQVVMDLSIPVSDIALQLGRTWNAVTQRRYALRRLQNQN